MSIITSGRTNPCRDIMGGIKKIYLFSYIKYGAYEMTLNGNELVTFPTTTIYEYGIRGEDNFFNEDKEIGDEGESYTQSLSANLKVLILDRKKVFDLSQKIIRAIVVFNDGSNRVLGLLNGLRIDKLSGETGGGFVDFNGYKIELIGKELETAPYVTNLQSAGFIIDGQTETFCLLQEDGFNILQENNDKILLENG